MKIVSIKFLNLNSLKGEQEIRFDEPPFTESGLFAITGPTGAGKTTILDAITVALYGRVHRHNKDASEIMSRHTAECYSEVEFEVKDNVYRAKWSLRRSRGKVNGTLQPNKMELAEVSTGTLIGGHTLTSVQQAIVDLCGLDYNQFLRSVILSQGDFTRFLKADENERSDLLEKITDTGIYSEISRFTFERAKEEKEKLEALCSKLKDVELLSTDDRTMYEERRIQCSVEEKSIKEKHELIVKKISWLNNLESLELKKNDLAIQLSKQQSSLEENHQEFKRLLLHKQAMEFKPALVEIRSYQDHADKLKDELEKLDLQLPQIARDVDSARSALGEFKEQESRAQKELTDAKGPLEKVIQLDSELESIKLQVKRLSLSYSQSSKEVDDLGEKEEERNREFKDLELKITQLKVWLNENKEDGSLESQLLIFKQYIKELNQLSIALESAKREQERYLYQEREDVAFLSSNQQAIQKLKVEIRAVESGLNELSNKLKTEFGGKSLEDLELEAAELPSLITLCEQQFKLSKAYFLNHQKRKDLNQQISDNKTSYKEQTEALQLLHMQKEAAEGNLNDLRQLVELQQRIQKYEKDRQQLQAEQPCPLCGSLHHPFILNHYQGELTETEKRRNEQDKFVRELTEALNLKSVEANTLKLTLQSREEQLVQLDLNLNEITQEFNRINTSLPKELDIDKTDTINAIIQRKRQQFEVLQKDIKQLRDLKLQHNDNQNVLSAKRELLIQAESKSEAATVRIDSVREQTTRVSKLIDGYLIDQNRILENISVLLSQYHIEYDHQHAGNIEQALSDRSDRYVKCGRELQEFSLVYTRINTEMKSIGESLADKLSVKLKLGAELGQEKEKQKKLETERFALFGDKSPSDEWERLNQKAKERRELCERAQGILQGKQEQLKVKESRLSQLKLEYQSALDKLELLNDQLTADIQLKGVPTIEVLNQLFLPEMEAQRLANLEKSIETSIATFTQMLNATYAELRAEASRELTTQSVEELKPEIDQLDSEISTLNQEIGRLIQILEEDNRLKTRFAEVATDIEIQQQEYARWLKLSSLIGSADGKKFSRFAQGLTLARLTDLANRHLVKLTDRYQILKSKEKDLELQIVDGYQADVVRPMATLSGGESFLVSLALALGLSDLASRKVQINSLFIDEGFGTLDAETLDIAISALENLQAKGKSIGIISHVDALKERIGTQIQVTKLPGGSSKIKVLSYSKEFLEV